MGENYPSETMDKNLFMSQNHISYFVPPLATIRVRDEIYRELNRVAGELRLETGRPVSMDEVLERLLKFRKLKPSDFQGAWKMTDKEAEQLFKSLREHWSRWKYPSD